MYPTCPATNFCKQENQLKISYILIIILYSYIELDYIITLIGMRKTDLRINTYPLQTRSPFQKQIMQKVRDYASEEDGASSADTKGAGGLASSYNPHSAMTQSSTGRSLPPVFVPSIALTVSS